MGLRGVGDGVGGGVDGGSGGLGQTLIKDKPKKVQLVAVFVQNRNLSPPLLLLGTRQ